MICYNYIKYVKWKIFILKYKINDIYEYCKKLIREEGKKLILSDATD